MLMPLLTPDAIEAALGAVIERANSTGALCHEETIGNISPSHQRHITDFVRQSYPMIRRLRFFCEHTAAISPLTRPSFTYSVTQSGQYRQWKARSRKHSLL